MNLKKNQQQRGYIAVATLIFMIGAIVVLTFVIELGRLIIVSAKVDNGIDLAASGGVHNYGKVLKEKTKAEYTVAHAEATSEVDAEIALAGLPVTPQERELMITVKTKAKMALKSFQIKSAARAACNTKIEEILSLNNIVNITHSCTDSEVYVKGKQEYVPGLANIPSLHSKAVVREIKKKIVLNSS